MKKKKSTLFILFSRIGAFSIDMIQRLGKGTSSLNLWLFQMALHVLPVFNPSIKTIFQLILPADTKIQISLFWLAQPGHWRCEKRCVEYSSWHLPQTFATLPRWVLFFIQSSIQYPSIIESLSSITLLNKIQFLRDS